jgi:hypothetical protein
MKKLTFLLVLVPTIAHADYALLYPAGYSRPGVQLETIEACRRGAAEMYHFWYTSGRYNFLCMNTKTGVIEEEIKCDDRKCTAYQKADK